MELTLTDEIMLEIHYVIIAYIILFTIGIISVKKWDYLFRQSNLFIILDKMIVEVFCITW